MGPYKPAIPRQRLFRAHQQGIVWNTIPFYAQAEPQCDINQSLHHGNTCLNKTRLAWLPPLMTSSDGQGLSKLDFSLHAGYSPQYNSSAHLQCMHPFSYMYIQYCIHASVRALNMSYLTLRWSLGMVTVPHRVVTQEFKHRRTVLPASGRKYPPSHVLKKVENKCCHA